MGWKANRSLCFKQALPIPMMEWKDWRRPKMMARTPTNGHKPILLPTSKNPFVSNASAPTNMPATHRSTLTSPKNTYNSSRQIANFILLTLSVPSTPSKATLSKSYLRKGSSKIKEDFNKEGRGMECPWEKSIVGWDHNMSSTPSR